MRLEQVNLVSFKQSRGWRHSPLPCACCCSARNFYRLTGVLGPWPWEDPLVWSQKRECCLRVVRSWPSCLRGAAWCWFGSGSGCRCPRVRCMPSEWRSCSPANKNKQDFRTAQQQWYTYICLQISEPVWSLAHPDKAFAIAHIRCLHYFARSIAVASLTQLVIATPVLESLDLKIERGFICLQQVLHFNI